MKLKYKRFMSDVRICLMAAGFASIGVLIATGIFYLVYLYGGE